MAKNRPTKIISKKHLARQERERRQTRLITGVAIGIVSIIILAIAYGLLNGTLLLRFRPAVTVNGESLSMQDFQVRVKVARQQLINQYMQYTQLAQMFGMDPNSDPQLSQSLQQISGQLDMPSTIGGQVLNDMIDDLVVRQYAKANGIVVTEADIENAIQSKAGYYPSGTPTTTLTPTELTYPTLDATQIALISPTPTPTIAPTYTSRPTWTPNLTNTVTPVPSITPTATPYTLDIFNQNYKQGVDYYAQFGMSEAEFRQTFYEFTLYRQRVQDVVTADVTHEQDQVWVRQILVSDEATANSIRTQLLAGADFAQLAAQNSLDTASKDNGGDLGWLGADAMTSQYGADLEAAAFSLKVGEISQPIHSTYGYIIAQVLGHEVRPLTDQEYQDAVTNAFNNWISEQRTNSNIVINSNWTNYVPDTPTIAQAQADEGATETSYVSTYIAGATLAAPTSSGPTPAGTAQPTP